ncbi:MAG: PH domain-containing protein [Lachnospiraceae bacterium]|nr:PH domain-containing protein [Lachnospiraceae bacterium]
MAEEKKLPFELQEGEEVLREFASDYWEKFLFMYSQKRGRYYMTNRRVIFVYFGDVMLDLPYAEMESAVLCNVGALIKFVPTGIKVTMKDGNTYDLSVVKRKEIHEIIMINMQNAQ